MTTLCMHAGIDVADGMNSCLDNMCWSCWGSGRLVSKAQILGRHTAVARRKLLRIMKVRFPRLISAMRGCQTLLCSDP